MLWMLISRCFKDVGKEMNITMLAGDQRVSCLCSPVFSGTVR